MSTSLAAPECSFTSNPLAFTVSLACSLECSYQQRLYRSPEMHKTPIQIARSLRAFRNAQRLGLLSHVRISPARGACEAAHMLRVIKYPGSAVPRLPLAQCTSDECECKYAPVGSDKLRRLYAPRKSCVNCFLEIGLLRAQMRLCPLLAQSADSVRRTCPLPGIKRTSLRGVHCAGLMVSGWHC